MDIYRNTLGIGKIFSKTRNFALGTAAIAALVLAGNTALVKSAHAAWDVKPRATGIGYAFSRRQARRYAKDAWVRAVRRVYGWQYADLRNARSKNMSCARIGKGPRIRRRGAVVGTKGDYNHPVTCTFKANPAKFVQRRCPSKAVGIGYHNVEAGARGLAVRAWSNGVRRRCGSRYADFNRARPKNVSCARIGATIRERGYGDAIVNTEGNPNSRYTCTANGTPRRF